MMFFVTVMVGLLYGLIGVLTPALLALRVEETAIGAVSAALAVVVILPVTTHQLTDAWSRRAMDCVRACAGAADRGEREEAADRLAEYQALHAALAALEPPLDSRPRAPFVPAA
ncbi:hypothetical protein ACFQLX_05375 [Streptomyces polyrhachis]|uniref:Uncharacterized protein n=1 Tax=Streptomyces polyrhachis TaxID=1282885 RepID=A0ABW2GDH6_9ACTN